ncbi:MAG: FAD-dependent oxidoreductase, partial [Thermoleophilaceae bacterium]
GGGLARMRTRARTRRVRRVGTFGVVICGGGVAAVEGMLRLRRFAGERVQITLLAPNDELVYRPLAVHEAVAFGRTRRYPLRDIARDCDAEWVKDVVASVDTRERAVQTGEGRRLSYDALLVAVGGRQMADHEHVLTFRDAEAGRLYERVIEDVEDEHARGVAFLVPEGPVYPLPAYELALLTAERARRANVEGLALYLVTPEPAPLAAFGGSAGAVVGGLLVDAGIEVFTSATAFVPRPRTLLVQPQGVELAPDRIVAMPRITGPGIAGLPGGGPYGFIPIDPRCAVPGTAGRVFAAGDATTFPIKHGGVGSQQADTAAAAIARLAGADAEAARFRPEVRGKLLTGGKPLYLSARLVGVQGFDAQVFDTPPWPVDDKIVAEELGPYLAGVDGRTGAL